MPIDPPDSTPEAPKATPPNALSRRWDLWSLLAFQAVIMIYWVVVLGAMQNWGPWADGSGCIVVALRRGLLYTLPVAAAGVALGLTAMLSHRPKKALGMIGLILNGMQVLLCLVVLRS